ncbi:MAG: cation-efflux pump [Actinobacteria bacterium]|nr:cation-efflux pump [Actinomycetota bacterium]
MTDKVKYKRRVALFSLVISLVLVAIKIAVAYFSNSIGVFSEALNNSLDVVTVLITFLAVRMATRPPDKDHTYGHGKYENLSAMFEVLIIAFLSFFIIFKSIQRIVLRNFELELNNYIFIVLGISIIINVVRVYFVGNAAKKYDSFAFKAEFINYLSDIISSVIVITGLLFARSGFYLADPVASIIVSFIILGLSVRLAIKIVRNFLDYIPREITEKVSGLLEKMPEVESVNKVQIHEVGDIKFINLDISVNDNVYLTQLEAIKESIKETIAQNISGCQTMIEIKPHLSEDNIDCMVKEIAMGQPNVKDVHNMFIYRVDGQLDISIHLEMNRSLNLEESEKLTKKTELLIKEKIRDARNVYIHIEEEKSGADWDDITHKSEDLINRIKKDIEVYVSPETCHEFTILERRGVFNIAFHCRLSKSTGIKEAHTVISKIEDRIKHISENIGEVVIHMEPV